MESNTAIDALYRTYHTLSSLQRLPQNNPTRLSRRGGSNSSNPPIPTRLQLGILYLFLWDSLSRSFFLSHTLSSHDLRKLQHFHGYVIVFPRGSSWLETPSKSGIKQPHFKICGLDIFHSLLCRDSDARFVSASIAAGVCSWGFCKK